MLVFPHPARGSGRPLKLNTERSAERENGILIPPEVKSPRWAVVGRRVLRIGRSQPSAFQEKCGDPDDSRKRRESSRNYECKVYWHCERFPSCELSLAHIPVPIVFQKYAEGESNDTAGQYRQSHRERYGFAAQVSVQRVEDGHQYGDVAKYLAHHLSDGLFSSHTQPACNTSQATGANPGKHKADEKRHARWL